MGLGERWLKAVYGDATWLRLLRPLEFLYCKAVARRAFAYRTGRRAIWQAEVPVIVVGNVTLGGTGKSPLVAWLGRYLVSRGWHPGIVSRGYGGNAGNEYPLRVAGDTEVERCGDEPRMLARQTGLPVVVDPDRPRGARALIEAGCDIVISDDGLQHLALGRDIELIVVDGRRGFGNGRCLPAGPLREPLGRLDDADAVLMNGDPIFAPPQGAWVFRLVSREWRSLADGARCALTPLPFSGPVHAVAGIGNPGRFFATLADLGIEVIPHGFADHYHFTAADLAFDDGRPVVMTAKDAEKCQAIAPPDSWVLEVEAEPEPGFEAWLEARLATLR
ncbi:tetraacyldisaccharide 4'-kinase [Billgrantia endophytica]|uniref:Tetraacyldisaccharide 4'-kinase n=1 Tax=Billgrantia endophytica TaxID=2033802 RepID=A0A2N7TVL2_9GAMM|nr:tetraacyldisaccharide 4'-kinase [Halomonas endophytica]PMR72234.1 tetraacyldisaccharide 4'-kinase [Halomonas endophytica]